MHDSQVKAPRFPDFIIGGAPKCGTTSLHFILAQSPSVGIPEDEVHYFDADDPVGHPDFLFTDRDGLVWYDPRQGNSDGIAWYAKHFERFADTPFVGEDSTIYLQSEVAAARIADLLPDAKLVFMLRDPVKRAYSQYWHLVTRGRTTSSFEDALSRHPSIVLGSTYAPHLRRYLDMFGQDRVHVGLFEDFLADRQGFIDSLTSFLGIPQITLRESDTWFNRTHYPTSLAMQCAINSVSARIVRNQYRNHFGQRQGVRERSRNKLHYYWFRYVHPILLKSTRQPPMAEGTRQYLTQHFSARNAGLSQLLGRDLSEVWPGFEG